MVLSRPCGTFGLRRRSSKSWLYIYCMHVGYMMSCFTDCFTASPLYWPSPLLPPSFLGQPLISYHVQLLFSLPTKGKSTDITIRPRPFIDKCTMRTYPWPRIPTSSTRSSRRVDSQIIKCLRGGIRSFLTECSATSVSLRCCLSALTTTVRMGFTCRFGDGEESLPSVTRK